MSQTYSEFASILLDVSVGKLLDYGVPTSLEGKVRKGMRVEVPLKGKNNFGYVYAIKQKADFPKIQPIKRLLAEEEVLTDELFELGLWIAKYYCVPLKEAFKTMLPAIVRKDSKHKEQYYVMRAKTREDIGNYCQEIRNKHSAQAAILDAMLLVKKGMLLSELLEETGVSRSAVDSLAKKGLLKIDIVRIDRSPLVNEEYFQTKPKELNPPQAEAFDKICTAMDQHIFETHLLYGVTGSGKTEIYLQSIEKALQMNQGAIMLVPEISLTAQTIERFRSRFEGNIAILHHRLSEGERYDEWHRIRRGEAKIVIGARSAVFSPVKNLGLIIVDEEHEQSYKQSESAPCYNARDVAVMRGKMSRSVVILGSATPSLESYYNATSKKYILSALPFRADTATIPKFTIVNMKSEFEKNGGYTNFSSALLDGIQSRQKKGEQTILFLNRRGYHTTLFCKGCSQPVKCSHCDVALTFHLGSNHLACHLCGFTLSPPPQCCPSCKSLDTMKFRGVGTEQIERALHAIFPEIRTTRVDADTTRHKGSHQKLLRDFGSGKADVLIGTQMIAKGLHFPEVTLVGVLNGDSSLQIPDFRAAETAFQLITQVAGRAGRGHVKGEVIVQTCMPENTTLKLAAEQNYEKFYEEEISVRKLFEYPPFASMTKLTFTGIHEEETKQAAVVYRKKLTTLLPENFTLYPIIPSGHAKVKDKFRFQLLIKGPSVFPIGQALEAVNQQFTLPKEIRLLTDINPSSTFF